MPPSQPLYDTSEAQTAVVMRDVEFDWGGTAGFHISVPHFSLARGEKLFLFGESGSGKSTLLSLICGIIDARQGVIQVGETDIVTLSGRARDRFRAEQIGVIFQMFNLLPYASPLDNILLPLSFAPVRRARVGENLPGEAARLAVEMGLPADILTQRASTDLSVGQQQRVAVARALIGSPPLIIADEPTSALDAATQDRFLDLMFAQVDARNASLIMVSHDMRLAEKFDRVANLTDIAQIRHGATA